MWHRLWWLGALRAPVHSRTASPSTPKQRPEAHCLQTCFSCVVVCLQLTTPHPEAGSPPASGAVCFGTSVASSRWFDSKCAWTQQITVCACVYAPGDPVTYVYQLQSPTKGTDRVDLDRQGTLYRAAYCGTAGLLPPPSPPPPRPPPPPPPLPSAPPSAPRPPSAPTSMCHPGCPGSLGDSIALTEAWRSTGGNPLSNDEIAASPWGAATIPGSSPWPSPALKVADVSADLAGDMFLKARALAPGGVGKDAWFRFEGGAGDRMAMAGDSGQAVSGCGVPYRAVWYGFSGGDQYRLPSPRSSAFRLPAAGDAPQLATVMMQKGDSSAPFDDATRWLGGDYRWFQSIPTCACSYDDGATITYTYQLVQDRRWELNHQDVWWGFCGTTLAQRPQPPATPPKAPPYWWKSPPPPRSPGASAPPSAPPPPPPPAPRPPPLPLIPPPPPSSPPPPTPPSVPSAMCHADCPQYLAASTALTDSWRSPNHEVGGSSICARDGFSYSCPQCDSAIPSAAQFGRLYSSGTSLETAHWYARVPGIRCAPSDCVCTRAI